jgi:hypothetical protein
MQTRIETARGTDPARMEIQHYAWALFSLLNGASSMVFMSMLGRARPAHQEALARMQREKLMKDEIAALRNNETKREALASKLMIGFRAVYADALKTSQGDKSAVADKIDESFGDIDRLSKESARLFVEMITPGSPVGAFLPVAPSAPTGGQGRMPAGFPSTQSVARAKAAQDRQTG